MKKLGLAILVLLYILSFSTPVFATGLEGDIEATTEHIKTTEYPNEPGRKPDIVANAAIVMDAATGQILYEKNIYEHKYPASITKIMTTILALNKGISFDEPYIMTENAVWGVERDSTIASLDVGEQVTLGDLVYATMVHSANDCAYALAEYIGGDVETFANMMNEKAAELGCENTHFVTPNGLHDDNHYTCAYDMALITKYALENDTFRQVAGTTSYSIPPTNLADEERFWWNGNKMILSDSPFYYEYCEGGKTGYTMIANNTLVTFSKKDNLELICVILDCDGGANYAYTDSKALYNYCYNNYTYFYPLSDFSFQSEEEDLNMRNSILDNYYYSLNHDMVDLVVDKEYSLLLNRSVDTSQIQQTVTFYDKAKDNVLGEISFTYNDEQIGVTPIKTTTPTLASTMSQNHEEEEQGFFSWKKIKKVLFNILCVFGALIGILAVYMLFAAIVRRIRRNNNRRRRYRRRKKRDDDYYF